MSLSKDLSVLMPVFVELTDLVGWLELVRALYAVDGRLDEALRRRNDLCVTWFEVMAELASADSPLRVSVLATRVTISQPRVSRVVAAMEARGLLARSAVDGDARGIEVELTPQGRNEFAAAAITYRDILGSSLLARLTDAETRTPRAIGEKLAREGRMQPGSAAGRRRMSETVSGCASGC